MVEAKPIRIRISDIQTADPTSSEGTTGFDPKEIPQYKKAGGDVRLVLLTSCQSGCNFCHLEGNKTEDELGTLNPALAGWKGKRGVPIGERFDNTVRPSDVDMTIKITRELGLSRVHLTGGEPTLHPDLFNIIDKLQSAGIEVGITTHGEISSKRLDKLISSGITGINFSIHASTPEEYLSMDLVAQKLEAEQKGKGLHYATNRLRRKKTNIELAARYTREENPDFKVKVNSVVQDADVAKRIVEWGNEIGVQVRLQRDLNNPHRSEDLIGQVIERLGAIPVSEDIAVGDSSGSGTLYEYPTNYRQTGKFKVKHFGEIYLAEMCGSCELKGTSDCRERFYGVRIKKDQVTTCIDVEKNGVTSFSQDEFLNQLNKGKGVPIAIKNQYAAMDTEN